ncbi:MAG TPA: RNA polymerase sigma factor [Bacteroidales bacterium]|nr:RNA polymerase sigma factor [Bacteroidales bacterium]
MQEQELISGLIQRDRKAFRVFVEEHHKRIMKTAAYFAGNMTDAEDIAQEVFIEIIRSIGKFRRTASLNTWVYRITVNKSLDYLRKRKRRELVHRLESFLSPEKGDQTRKQPELPSVEPDTSGKERQKILDAAIASLSTNQRIAFILSKYEDLPYKEIAGIMGMSVPSVESLIHRAKMNLQKKLASHFTEYLIKRK